MGTIFISYRREDSAGWTGRLAERLKQKFGAESIFMDIDTIQAGTDFTDVLRSAVGACDVLLAMIGPTWGSPQNAEGQTRLQDPNDWVRTELATALGRGIPVIPVLVGGASLPKLGTLPDDLKKLFNYQAHELTDKRWEYDSSQLVQVLEKVVRGAKPKRNIAQTILTSRPTWVALVILGITLALGSMQFFERMSSTDNAASQKNEAAVLDSVVVTPPPEPKIPEMPLPALAGPTEKPTENSAHNQQSAEDQQKPASPVARPIPTSEKSGSKSLILSAGAINLLSPRNGGHIIAADNETWSYTVDGDQNSKISGDINGSAVYGFKNNGPAKFETFKVWIPETSGTNLNEFELLAGNDSPGGKFESVGKFQTQNLRFFKDPWQEFKFPPVKAKYLKVKLISNHGPYSTITVYEFQLLGVLEK